MFSSLESPTSPTHHRLLVLCHPTSKTKQKQIVKPLHKINPLTKLYWKRPSNSKLITFVSNPRKVRPTQTPCTPPERTSSILSSQPSYARLRAHQCAALNRTPPPPLLHSPTPPQKTVSFSNPEQNWKLRKDVTLLAMATDNGRRNRHKDKAGISNHALSWQSWNFPPCTIFRQGERFISCHFIVTEITAGKPSVCYLSVGLALKRSRRTVVEQV